MHITDQNLIKKFEFTWRIRNVRKAEIYEVDCRSTTAVFVWSQGDVLSTSDLSKGVGVS